jgi:ribosome-associated translation inhibitor RaiA
MNLQITGDNFDLSDSNRQLINQKVSEHLDKLLTNFDPDIKIASMRISKDKLGNFSVNFDMNLPGKTHIFAKTTNKIFESALIDLTQNIEKQIKKYREDLAGYSLG